MEQTEPNVILHLDIYFSSDLLIQKIRDIPMKEKLEKLVAPILHIVMFDKSLISELHVHKLDLICDGKFISNVLVKNFYSKYWLDVVNHLQLWDYREFVLQVVEQYGYLLDHVKKKELLEDREIILGSVRSYPENYEIVSDTFKNDKEITLIAVSKDPMHIRHASKELRGDRDVAKCALLQSGYTFRYISEELKKDKEFISNIFNNDKSVIEYIYSFE